jgi:aminoglycoside phosphotransferase (APT) family kinase protein
VGRSGRRLALAAELDDECEVLVRNGVLPADLVTRNRQVAEAAFRPWTAAFTHGDLQIAHVFVDGDEVTGTIDWSEAGQGDALYDLATFVSLSKWISVSRKILLVLGCMNNLKAGTGD